MLYTFEVLALPKSIITMHANVCLDLQKFQFVKSGNVYIYSLYPSLYTQISRWICYAHCRDQLQLRTSSLSCSTGTTITELWLLLAVCFCRLRKWRLRLKKRKCGTQCRTLEPTQETWITCKTFSGVWFLHCGKSEGVESVVLVLDLTRAKSWAVPCICSAFVAVWIEPHPYQHSPQFVRK